MTLLGSEGLMHILAMSRKSRKKQKKNPNMDFREKLKSILYSYDSDPHYGMNHNCSDNHIAPSNRTLIYTSELDYIARCIQDFPNVETGGQLFGAWTASGAPRIIYAIGPGPMANHQQAFFNQDINYLESIGAELKKYGLQHIGEWHSHHTLGLAHLSGHDAQTMQNGVENLNLNRLCLCIGNIDHAGRISINPFNFAKGTRYVDAEWEIIISENRLRKVIDVELADKLRHPSTTNTDYSREYIPKPVSMFDNQGWFSNQDNRKQFKLILDKLKEQSWISEVKPLMEDGGLVSIQIKTNKFSQTIQFPIDFPNSSFELTHTSYIERTNVKYSIDNWEIKCDQSLFEMFWEGYVSINKKINGQ